MTRIVAECLECDHLGVTTEVNHEPGTERYQKIRWAHELVVREHNEETNHGAELEIEEVQ